MTRDVACADNSVAKQIPIVYDDFEEDDETFYVIIENIVAGDVGIGAQRCCVTIRDCGAPRAEMEGDGAHHDDLSLSLLSLSLSLSLSL